MYKLASLVPAPDEELPIIGIAHTLIGNTVGETLIIDDLVVYDKNLSNKIRQTYIYVSNNINNAHNKTLNNHI